MEENDKTHYTVMIVNKKQLCTTITGSVMKRKTTNNKVKRDANRI